MDIFLQDLSELLTMKWCFRIEKKDFWPKLYVCLHLC